MKKNNQSFESARKHVDKYAATILGRISDEKERNSRGFQVAKLYVNIKEYDVAKRYMAGFLAVKPSYAPAHKLMGHIYEKLGDTKKSISAYKFSLELDDSQKDILLTICELYCTTDVDPEQAKYWADRVEKIFPRKNIGFRLREKIYSTTSNLDINHNEMAQLLAQELKKHPRDVALHMKLLRLYIDQGRVNEAYAHAVETEHLKPYPESLEWYQCLADIFQEYSQENGGDINGMFHEHLLGVLCNLSAVSLRKANIFDCMEILHKLDQTLQKVSEMQLPQEAWRQFFEEIKAQFFYHAGTLLCKKAKQLRLSWREACDMAAACFAVSATVLPLDTQANWFRQTDNKQTYEHWARVGALRLSQVAHMLIDMQKRRDCDWQRTLQAEVFTREGQERLFQLLFNTPHLQQNRDRSYLLNCSAFDDISMAIPSNDTLQLYDDISDQLLPQSLHRIVWKALHHYSAQDSRQPQYDFKVFADLYEGGVNIDQTTAPETLCQYDIEAFLCLAIHCAALRLAEYERSIPDESGQPRLLPASICDTLTLPQQEDWWQATYSLYTNSNSEDLGRLRLTVSSGLGVVRMRGHHGLDPRLGIHLARTSQQRWEDAIEAGSPDIDHRQSRALYYWRSVVDTLSDLDRQQKHGHRIQRPLTQLFPLTDSAPLSEGVLKECADEGRFLLGRIAMTEGRTEEAINQFKLVNTPSANLDLGKAYRELAARVVRQPQLGDMNTDRRLQQVALLTKSRDVLYSTFSNVARKNNQELYASISAEVELVEGELNDLGVTTGTKPKQLAGGDELDTRRKSPERVASFSPHSPVTPPSPAKSERNTPRHSERTNTPQPTNTSDSYNLTIFCLVNQLEESRKTIEKLKEKVERLELRSTPTYHPSFPGYPGGSPMYYPGPYPPAPGYGALMSGIPPTPPFPMMQQSPAAMYQSPQFVPAVSSGGAGDVYNGGVTTTHYNGEEFVTVEEVDTPQPPADWSAAYGPIAHMMTPRPPMPMRPPMPGVGLFTPQSGYGLSNLPMPRPGFFARHGATQPQLPPPHIPPEIATPPGGVLQQDTACGPNRNRSVRGVAPPRAQTQEMPWMPQLNDYNVEFPPETQDLFVSSTPYLGHYQEPQSATDAPKTDALQKESTAEVKGHDAVSYDEQDYEEEHVSYSRDDSHDPEFTPIVQLPEEVELVTGEEDSTPLFSSRAKLYRFVDSQWKERGVGTIKILYNAMLGRTRVVMRRDQVHKVCANHLVQPGASITYKDEEKKTLLWTALDFTDDDGPHMENFCCRFKTAETAAQFKDMYEQSEGLSGMSDDAAATNKPLADSATASKDKSAEKPSLSALFGVKPGSWECETCLVRNPADVTVCPACLTPKPGSEAASRDKEEKPVAAISMNAGGGFKFAAAGGMSAQFGGVAFSSTPVKSSEEISSFHTPATFAFGTPAASASPAVVSGQSSGQAQGVTTDKPSPAVTLFGKKDAESKQPSAESDQTVPVSVGFTGTFGQPAMTVVSSAPSTSFTFSAQSTSGTPFSFGTANFGETVSSASMTPTQSSTTETKTVIGGFSFVGSNITQTVVVTTAAPVKASAKATDKPNPFATFSFASPKAEVVSTVSDGGSVKPFGMFGSSATSAAPIFGGFGAATPTVPDSSTTTSTSSIFGGATSAPVFSSTAGTTKTTSASSIFGGAAPAPIFGSTVSTAETTSASSVFGSATSAPVFGSASTGANTFSMFGAATPAPIFGTVKTEDNPTSDTNSGMTFGNSASAMTFASVAAKGESPEAFSRKSESATGFQMGTGKLFESLTSPNGRHDTSEGHTEDYEPTAEFEPVVSLPHVIELKTGEEDEDKIFGERARLYRLDNNTKQWKERGIGIIKILKHQHTRKHRIVMRREQVLKLCANHNLVADMTLRPLATSDRAWCWFARDFAEDDSSGEGTLEHLAAKFKTPEIAVRFKDLFEDCVMQATNASWDTYEKPDSTTEDSTDAVVACGNLMDIFRLKNGEWQCDVCLVKNIATAVQCAACTTPRPSSEVTSSSKPVATPSVKGGTLKLAELLSASEPDEPIRKGGKEQSLAEFFRMKNGEWECDACLVKNKPASTKCAACETPKPGSNQESTVSSSSVSSSHPLNTSSTGGFNFSFGGGDASKSVTPSTGFSFDRFVSSSPGTFSFGGADAKSSGVPSLFGTPAVATSGSTPFTPSGFTFTASLSTPTNQPLDLSKSPLQSPELYHEEETNVYFEPVVHLPDDYEVKTGEEDEEILYVHRAKLYRFDAGEWKERGLGDVKLLCHRATRRTRVLMRREQVLKICLNHQVAPELELKPMAGADGCAWVWHADDFADGSSKHEQFAIRFKTANDAEEFKAVFDSAKEGRETGSVGPPPSSAIKAQPAEDDKAVADTSDSDDVIIVYEKRPTPEQIERARAWQLPDTFYLYEDTPPCPGCIGCDPDDQGTCPSRIPRPLGKAPSSESTNTKAPQSQLLRQPLFSAPSLGKGPDTAPKAEKSSSLPRFTGFGLTKPAEGSPVSSGAGTGEAGKSQLKELLFGGSKLGQVIPSVVSSGSGSKAVETTTDKAGSGGGIVFGGGNKFSGEGFAGLAAQASTGYAFGKKSDEPFAFSGAGTTLFGGAANTSTATDQDNGDESYVSQEANVHFEPVVSLPEVTDLRTGEEGCDVLFCQRAKLYRFTDKQWKERGIGEMKLLRKADTGRVRVLLRREQVLKLACNHNLTPDMTLQPLLTSETSWCWSAQDYVDGEGRHEQFAVKFKTKDIATEFKDIFEQCQQQLVAGPAEEDDDDDDTDDDDDDSEETHLEELSAVHSSTVGVDTAPSTHLDTVSDTQTQRVSGTNVNADEQDYTPHDYDDDDDDDSQEQAEQLFWKRMTMSYIEDGKAVLKGQGELYIVVDEDVAGLRVYMVEDAGNMLCNHVICCGYTITKTPKMKNCCEWAAQDFSTDEPIPRHFRASLSSAEAVEEFIYCFQQGVQRAQESQLYESMPEMVPIHPGQTSDGTTAL